MSTSSLQSFIKIHRAVLEKKLKMWKFTDGRTDGRTDDGRCAMTIAHLSLWLRWAKNMSAISGAQLVPIGIPTICWYTVPSNCICIFSMRKESKSFAKLSASSIFIRVIFLVGKNPALSEVQRYVFYSLLKHHLKRDNTFSLIWSCGKDVDKVENSKKDTVEPWTFHSRNFSMTAEEF